MDAYMMCLWSTRGNARNDEAHQAQHLGRRAVKLFDTLLLGHVESLGSLEFAIDLKAAFDRSVAALFISACQPQLTQRARCNLKSLGESLAGYKPMFPAAFLRGLAMVERVLLQKPPAAWQKEEGAHTRGNSTYLVHGFGPIPNFFYLGTERGSPQSLPSISTLRDWPGGKGALTPSCEIHKRCLSRTPQILQPKATTHHSRMICKYAAYARTGCFERQVCPSLVNKPKSTNSQVAS